MFAQAIIYLLIAILFCWLLWKFVIKPIMEAYGIEIEEDIVITDQTRKLKKLREEAKLMSESAKAAEEGIEVAKDIKYFEDRIKESEEKIKEINK